MRRAFVPKKRGDLRPCLRLRVFWNNKSMRKTLLSFLSALLLLPAVCSTSSAAISLEGVVTAMGDGVTGSGYWVSSWLRETQARVAFDASLKTPSGRGAETVGGVLRPVVLINSDIQGRTDGYRYYAVLIARESAELIFTGYPETAEKRYMVYATMAEAYFELYGTRMDLPVFSGVKDEEAARQVRVWVENDADGGTEAIARSEGAKRLGDLITEAEAAVSQSPQDPQAQARLTGLKNSRNYFENTFKPREKIWWQYYQPR